MPKAKPLVGEKTDQVTQHGRDVYVTDEGDNVSELSVTIPIGDKWYNAPSIYDGVRYEEGEVADMIKGGKIKPTSIHDSLEDALDAAQGRTDDIKYAKGGDTMNKQMKLFAEGGMMDDSGEVVNGVEVPPGSLKQEVADDVPAQLSEGEFVVPADVVRFIGLEKLMAMRDKAKAGLKRMQEMGQMGNAQEVDNPDQLFGDDGMPEEDLSGFESEIDSILAEDEQAFASGGSVMKFADGGTPPDMSMPERKYGNAPIVGFKMTKYTNADGDVKYIPTMDGEPLLPVPDGYKAGSASPVEEPTVEEPKVEEPNAISNTGGGDGIAEGGDTGSSSGGGLPGEGISITGQDAAFTALAVAENPVAKVLAPTLTTIASFVANSYLDSQIDKMDAAADAVKGNVVADTGMHTFAKADGGIGTISSTKSTESQDIANFGGYFDSFGNFQNTLDGKPVAAGAQRGALSDMSGATDSTDANTGTGSGNAATGSTRGALSDMSGYASSTDAGTGTGSGNAATGSTRGALSDMGGGFGGDGGFGASGGFGSMGGADGASVGGGGEARGGFISPKTSAKRRAVAKKGLASKRK